MITGRLEAFFETGTEGVIWSLSDRRLPGYDGLWPLCNGDHLRIIGAADETLWEGTIELEYQRNWQPYQQNPTYGQQAVFDFWVHGLQVDLDPEQWAQFFFDGYRASLTLGPKQTPRPLHPFIGPSGEMEARLRAAPHPARLYRAALYPWLWFLSNKDDYYSLAKEWQFSLSETLRLLGSPTTAQVLAWKTYPKQADDTLMPFAWDTFVRIALLFGVYGGLNRKFHSPDGAAAWLTETGTKDLLLRDVAGIAEVRDRLADPD
jgi:hypothetical protein